MQGWPGGQSQHQQRAPERAGWAVQQLAAAGLAVLGFVVAGVMLGPAAVALVVAGVHRAHRGRMRGWWVGLAALPAAGAGLIAHAHTLHLI